MTTSQDIKPSIKAVVAQSRNFYTMNREQIFLFLADVASISDDLADYVCDLTKAMAQVEKDVLIKHQADGMSKAAISEEIKRTNANYTAEKDWAKNQLSLLNSLRIAALSAQRSAE